MILGDEMIIDAVIKKEALRNNQMIEQYEKRIVDLPKGTLILRKNEYYYLKYRNQEGKVCDDYIGKDSDKVAEIRGKLEQRKHYEEMLASLKQEQKTIQKILEALK